MPLSPYSDRILFPGQIDTFPSLADNTSPLIQTNQIVYAEHHNKIANLIEAAQPLVTPVAAASGDLTVFGLGHVFRLWASLGDLYRVYGDEVANSPNINQPGNVLPFEFVLTSSPDQFYLKQTEAQFAGVRIIYQVPTLQQLNESAGAGLNLISNAPLVSVSLASSPFPTDPFQDLALLPITSMIVTHTSVFTPDSLLIRGHVINTAIDSTTNQANSESWMSSEYNFLLMASIVAVKRT